MSDFAFEISGDASKANRAADTVLDRLERIRQEAIKSSQGLSFDKLTSGFSKLAAALQKEQQTLQRTSQLHDQLTRQSQPLVKGFASLAEGIRREQEMLERIQGPTKRYIDDLRTLDSLLKKGAISQAEYNRATSSGATARASSSPGMLGGMRGMAAAAGVTVGAGQIGTMANEFQNLENRLRYLAGGDMAKVNQLFGELQGVAARTRADLSSTTEAFVRISLATKQMGLSSTDTLQLTERLNKAIALSGASGTEAAAGMIQLSQGLASGALRGDELRSVMEQLPGVADVLASGLGVTRGELRKLGTDGKITAEVIVESFKKAGASLDKDFGNTMPTIGQSFTAFKNELMVTIGELDKATGLSAGLGKALSFVGEVVKLALIPVEAFGLALGALGPAAGLAMGALTSIVMGNPIGLIAGAMVTAIVVLDEYTAAFDDVAGSWLEHGKKLEKLTELQNDANRTWLRTPEAINEAVKALTELNIRLTWGAGAAEAFRNALNGIGKADPWANAKAHTGIMSDLSNAITLGKIAWDKLTETKKKVKEEQTNEEKLLQRLHGAYDQANKDLISLEVIYAQGKIGAGEYANELERLQQALSDFRIANSGGVTGGIGSIAPANDNITGNMLDSAAGASMPFDVEAFTKGQEDLKQAVFEFNAAVVKANEDAAAASAAAWGEGLGNIANSFIDAARAGQQSFSEMTQNMLRDIAMLILKMAALQAIKNGVAGGSMSKGTGAFLTSLVGGFAHGGIIHEGNGGTDSQMVAFRKSPNERVIIETPEQQRTGALRGGSPGNTNVIVQVQENAHDIVEGGLSGRDGERIIARVDRRMGRRR